MLQKYVNRNIELGYQLTNYLLKNPSEELVNNTAENIVIFTNNDKGFNKFNIKLLYKLISQYQKVTVAMVDFRGHKEYWSFDTATRDNIPNIPFI